MAGFFDLEETQIIRGDEAKRERPLAVTSANCDTCGLHRTCNSPRMKPSGEGRLRILIVAEAPGETEDLKGTQLVGETGQDFREYLEELNLDLDRDFWKTNSLCCRPPKNANPEPLQLAACRKRLMAAIERYDPNVIITLGKFAMDGLIGHRLTGRLGEKDPSMTDWNGCCIPDQELGRWILPTWHPSYIARCGKDPVLIRQLQEQVKRAIELKDTPVLKRDYLSDCIPVYDVREAIQIIRQARKTGDYPALDYETTGLKPYRQGHEIVTAAVCPGNKAYAFPFFDDPEFREEWRRFLLTEKVRKSAHGKKFESVWTRVILGYWPVIHDCTMLGAHSAHNKKLTNLKFQTYVNFGVMGYDSEIDIYLKAPDAQKAIHGANAFNLIKQAPMDKLLVYNGADTLFGRLLRYKQHENQLTDHQKTGLQFFTDASLWLGKMEFNGIPLNVAGAKKAEKDLELKLEQIEDEIRKSPELKKWDKPTPFRPSADDDLGHLVYDLMGYEVKEFTSGGKSGKGKPKTDKKSMEKIDLPIVKLVLEWNKWDKARSTYVKGFIREVTDGIIHPFYNLQLVDTFRSSSSDPNFQNIPKRQKDVKKLIRSLLSPFPGCRFTEDDYKAVEVCVAACYNKDPNLVKYVSDYSTDMHRDTGMDIFFRPLEFFTNPKSKELGDLAKEERQIAKNGFVFPEFYGSYYEEVAPAIWGDISKETKDHLKANGVKNLKDFTAHIQDIEDVFWGERFPVYAEWKKKTYKEYEKKGYIDSYTGFRYYGPMKRNEVVNYPIQGSAFHCLLWTVMHVMEEMEKEGLLRSLFMGQIHDAGVDSRHPEEEARIDYLMWYWGTQKIREHWPWIIVPLNIEKSRSAIGGTWADMEDCGLLKGEFHA
jgi:uracil-DNA glycosylase family 4